LKETFEKEIFFLKIEEVKSISNLTSFSFSRKSEKLKPKLKIKLEKSPSLFLIFSLNSFSVISFIISYFLFLLF
jgi:hypothetical protein